MQFMIWPFLIFPFLFCVSIVFETRSFAEDLEIYTLEKSISEALEKNWTVKAVEETVEQANYFKNMARSDFFPKVGMTYNYTRLSEVQTIKSFFDIEIGSSDNYQWVGSISQPLFTGFALVSNYELASLGVNLAEIEVELNKLDLALGVKQAYFNVLIADKSVEVAEKDVASRESNVNVVRSFYNVGMSPINDLLKAEVALANTRQNLTKVRNNAKSARAGFNIILSRKVNEPVTVEDILNYEQVSVSFKDIQSLAFEKRPEIRSINTRIAQTDQEIRLARSDFYPDVTVTYNYIKAGDDPSVSGSDFTDAGHWEVMGSLSWTFWEWGKTRYSVKKGESAKKQLELTLSALEDSISLEIKDAILAIKTAEENIPTTKRAVEQAEENLRVNDERYKAQVSTITDVLDAQSLLTQARVNYYNSLYTHHLARAGLKRAIGTY